MPIPNRHWLLAAQNLLFRDMRSQNFSLQKLHSSKELVTIIDAADNKKHFLGYVHKRVGREIRFLHTYLEG